MPPAGPKATKPAYTPEEEEPYLPQAATPAPPPPTNYIPGSTYVPDLGQEPLYYETHPVPSETYGGPSGVEPQSWNDPNVIVTYYPASGAEPTAQQTGYLWTQHGRTPPSNYNKPIPASALKAPPPPPPFVESPNRFLPGPPRNFVPGSTYIPQNPRPDPRLPYEERVRDATPVNPTRVPGSALYRKGPAAELPYVSPGLGGPIEGPLSREGRGFAPRTQNWVSGDPREPDHYQPGSTFIPQYPLPPLGHPDATWHPIVPSEAYGAGLSENRRPKDKRRVDTIYPMSGATETFRFTDYQGGQVMQEGAGDGRVYSDTNPMGRLPGARIQDRKRTLELMEEARRNRRRILGLEGLFGGLS